MLQTNPFNLKWQVSYDDVALVLVGQDEVILKRGSRKELQKSIVAKTQNKLLVRPENLTGKEYVLKCPNPKQAAELAHVVTEQWASFLGIKVSDLVLEPSAKQHYRIPA